MTLRRLLSSTLPLILLAGCGFAPVYAPASSGTPMSQLGQIYVAVIPDRTGQELRQALQVRLEGSGAPSSKSYTLKISYGISTSGIGIDPSTDVTFMRYQGQANWQLLSAVPGTPPLVSGLASAQDGYSVIVNQYFYQSLETDALYQRMANNLADQIVVRLAAYFHDKDKVAQK